MSVDDGVGLLGALVKRKSVIKGQFTKLATFISSKGGDCNFDELNSRLSKINEIYNQFIATEDKIFQLNSKAESEMDEIDDQYYPLVTKIQGLIRSFSLQTVPETADLSTQSMPPNNFKSDFKLPRLTLPIFDGNYKQWQAFYDIFISTVHENTTLSPAQKFRYLLGQLRGPAYTTICHFRVDDANYVEALKRLIKKYDKKKVIVETYIRDFLSQPKVNANPSASNLLKIYDNIDETIRGLKSLGPSAIDRDPWIIYLAMEKLDEESRQLWKYETSETDFPTIDAFLAYLSKRIDALGDSSSKPRHNSSRLPSVSNSFHIATLPHCPVCPNEFHKLFSCHKFRNMNVESRRDLIKNLNRCYNCLSDEHVVTQCKNSKSCQKCHKRHNTSLHLPQGAKLYESNKDKCKMSGPSSSAAEQGTTMIANYIEPSRSSVSILPTIEIEIQDNFGKWIQFRALLDSGSTHSFVSERCINYLGIPRSKANISIDTLNNSKAGLSKGVSSLNIRSRVDHEYIVTTQAYILPTICSKLPMQPIDDHNSYFTFLKPLADPEFNKPKRVDVLLGCEHLFHALVDGKIAHMNGTPVARNSRFGWIIGGNFKMNEPYIPLNNSSNSMHVNLNPELLEWSSIENSLQRFWDTEEILTQHNFTEDESRCVKFFHDSVTYANNRVCVSLPFKQSPPNLGDNLSQALRRFYMLEKRLNSDNLLREAYVTFLHDYLKLGHMELIPEQEIMKQKNTIYYMPHHPVFKTTSTTTKVRVVFDASAKTASGESLNDNLLVGPTIQDNLVEILIRYRKHKYILSADIEKMFRQILVHPDDRDFQRIVWRENPLSKIKHFRLCTITYGTAPAPYLATQTLHYLAEKFASKFPLGSTILKRDFYMDDLMSGGDTIEETLQLQEELISLLKLGGLNLRKWSSNHPALLAKIPTENRELTSWEITNESKLISVLGIKYDPIQDDFFFRLSLPESNKFTKRSFLSETSRIFDPLGILAPVTIRLKILFQSLWLNGIGWDDELPQNVAQEWCIIRHQLNELTNLKLPRWIYAISELEFHGFADASKEAYAAVIYSRIVEGKTVKMNLVAAKTKVAPVKTTSIPRLELNAAALLVRLSELVQKSLCLLNSPKMYYYTDSTITLDWLSKPPKAWKSYIANRTSKILSCTSRNQWHHVSSKDNPADCATRGILPQDLMHNGVWFNGPDFLLKSTYKCPSELLEPQTVLQNYEKIPEFHLSLTSTDVSIVDKLFKSKENFRKLTRTIALLFRFIKNLRVEPHQRTVDSLKAMEIRQAETFIFRTIQENSYASEIKSLKKLLPLPTKTNLYSFFPFLDGHGLLRVGGRLEHADLSYDMKHPIILPSNHTIIEKLVSEMHVNNLHAGSKLLLAIIKRRFLIPRAKHLVRRITHQCIVCCRHRAAVQQQLMGQLPPSRINPPARAFLQTGIDLAGPFMIKTNRQRGAKSYKAYLVIFVCMATKATTLDLISDMSTDTFLAALKRFCAVRGVPSDIYCDNGTNLVGAKKELLEFYSQFLTQATRANILNWCTDQATQWHFIPPAAPTFGGLWEATVKSTKYHLRRVIADSILTYEEFLTLIKQIEALLNSRPLGDFDDDDCNPLTPGHFLIGQPITMLPEPNVDHIKINRLSRWQLIQSLLQGFWKRWSIEYVTSLNQFYKWHTPNHQINIGRLVLLRDQNLPPSKWSMARINDVHPGKDNLIRVVTVKLPNGNLLKRPISKICLLPIIDSNESTAAVCSNHH